jgi:signal transduction histidine kinase
VPPLTTFGPRQLLQQATAYLGEPPRLADLAILLEHAIPDVVERFYERIREDERAWSFISSDERFARLHDSLGAWLRGFLHDSPDTQARAEMAIRMAEAHLVIGMPLELTLMGHQLLQRLMLGELGARWPASDRAGLVDAIERLQRGFSWDSLLLVATYHSVSLARERASGERLAELNQQLQESMRAQENLVRTTSHELRTPLTGLLGLLNLLKRGVYQTEDERQRAEEDVYGAARHLLALVDDLLHLSRLELGKAGFQPKEMRLGAATEEILRRFRPRYEELGVQLTLAGDPDLKVFADPQRHAQVLSNLLQNALNHTFQGEVVVRISAMPGGGHVLTEVEDSGTGIEPDHVTRLFDPFAQGAEAGGNGLGLGLAICRRLVLRMGGRIRAHSQGIGHGSTFEFTLPAAGRRTAVPEEFGDPASPWRILLVDDDAVWRNDLGQWLAQELPVHVTAVGDPEDALRRAGQVPFKLFILDVAFPTEEGERGFDGMELLQTLALSPSSMLTPKWMVSGHGRLFLSSELRHSWHDRFWQKGEILSDRLPFMRALVQTLRIPPPE